MALPSVENENCESPSFSHLTPNLDNGFKVQVPPFIESDDEIVLDTRTLEYVKKI